MKTPNETGAALWFAIVAMVLLAAAGLGLIGLVDLETRMGSAYAAGTEAFYAADAVLERAVADLVTMDDWSAAIGGLVISPTADGTLQPMLASAERVDLAARTAALQAESRTRSPLGPNTPVWRLFLWGPFTAIGGGAGDLTTYVAAWVADDRSEVDGNPSLDANRVIVIHAEAFGVGRAHRMLEATIEREPAPAPGGGYWLASFAPIRKVSAPAGRMAVRSDIETEIGRVRLLAWREIR